MFKNKVLFMCLKDLVEEVKAIFGKLLERKQEADKVRKQLKIVDSYQYIFGMPVRIRRNIQVEKYEKVVSDYKKMNAILSGTVVPIFQKVKTEVEFIVEDFRSYLFRQLNDPLKSIQEQYKTIR